ncbi:hypothetical protein IMG5_071680 [Ichthyophthirius multifiliis]|uniref:Transmembrane protein n=1 Tax=Ichthyophthirius multifiliis TaxID=5932 RepID=G0QPV6_ICHMU|nr:hypothetical protein IMG5_071680 [Ichthyophthirius multifiliis]EGR32755.1 hypothetical protein IMG5_071680 [Ichthyophthirius multifiliis]|eukprot:XP_004036741.1 hypothetical protein IMG5_071680 [Ichthyophthirius multifiliis]
MSLNGILDVLVNISSFTNIDLFNQGLYNLKICIYYQNEDIKQNNITKILQDDQNCQNSIIYLIKNNFQQFSYIKDQYFYSKSFIIRYSDKYIQLNDICQFRGNIDFYPNDIQKNLYFVAKLYHTNYKENKKIILSKFLYLDLQYTKVKMVFFVCLIFYFLKIKEYMNFYQLFLINSNYLRPIYLFIHHQQVQI